LIGKRKSAVTKISKEISAKNLQQEAPTANRTEQIDEIFNLIRSEISTRLSNHNSLPCDNSFCGNKLEQFTPETNGTPIRAVVVSTWRSGSTFFGDMLKSLPEGIFHYEPLIPFGKIQIREISQAKRAINYLKMIFNCNFNTSMKNRISELQYRSLIGQRTQLLSFCDQNYRFCYRPHFIGTFCKLFPLQTMKLVRLRMKVAGELLRDER
jgi:chondroitin 6-sulfotransferase 3